MEPTQPVDTDVVTTVDIAGCVALPAGVEAAWVANGWGEVAVVDGCFVIEASVDGPQLAIATSAAGDPPAMSWLDAEDPAIDGHTTSEVLIFHAVGGFTVPPEQLEALRGVISKAPEVAGVAAVIEAQLAADPAAFAEPNAALGAALQGAVDTLLAPVTARPLATCLAPCGPLSI